MQNTYFHTSTNSHYYPYGMEMPNKVFYQPDNKYRYGFNGQEKDDDICNVSGSNLAFEFREYNSQICRFFAVDPLTEKYPYWAPYQFAGNMPIWAREFEGLEPVPGWDEAVQESNERMEKNDKLRPNYHMEVVDMMFELSGGKETGFDFSTNSSWNNYGTWTNNSDFKANNNISTGNFVNIMLGGFITGTGPANYSFENNAITEMVAQSDVVQSAMTEFYTLNSDALKSGGDLQTYTRGETPRNYGYFEQAADIIENYGVLSISNFIGSTNSIKIQPISDKEVQVTVVNETTRGSGDYFKHLLIFGEKATNIPRNPNNQNNSAYSTITQTFVFTLPINTK